MSQPPVPATHLVQPTLPEPRGIAFQLKSTEDSAHTAAAGRQAVPNTILSAGRWIITPVEHLPGWYEAILQIPMPLGDFWETVRRLETLPQVEFAEPLFLTVNPQPLTDVEVNEFAMGFGREQFGLWGQPYDRDVQKKIDEARSTENNDWHLKTLQVNDAWKTWKKRFPDREPGHGILVGHPDTGYTDHVEVKARLHGLGRSFLREQGAGDIDDARDDLIRMGVASDVLQQPGHGTGTASIIASRGDDFQPPAKDVWGIAPGATVLPLRVSRSVIHFDFSNVGRAILYAVEQGAHVISMSLGGPVYSEFLRTCIRHAHDRGVIVVSAAGNKVPATVFPAALPEVIAAAATNIADTPWRFSSAGRLVDIAAPGEDVWRAKASLNGGVPDFGASHGTGTSFATACVAGIAALWLSYHGLDTIAAHYGGKRELIPFAFQLLLERTAKKDFAWVRKGKHGAGIANADELLKATLPDIAAVTRFRDVIRKQKVSRLTFISGLISGGLGVTDAPASALTADATLDEQGNLRASDIDSTDAVKRATAEADAETTLIAQILGDDTAVLSDELFARIASDHLLLTSFQRWRQGESMLPLLDRLLGREAPPPAAAAVTTLSTTPDLPPVPSLSSQLNQRLIDRRRAEVLRLRRIHRGRLIPGVQVILPALPSRDGQPQTGAPDSSKRESRRGIDPREPAYRYLRAYAFDPSLDTKLDTAPINQVTIPVRWETVHPGPIGEYLEIVDVDPSSGCAYSPVDLNHPHVLGQNGLPPSEGSPQFHQQMVYAVAMNTIQRFELALGRPIFWAPIRPWFKERPNEQHMYTPEIHDALQNGSPNPSMLERDRYVQRLRIYPHALREPNAYYSPSKRALLFGYFPSIEDESGTHYPGGMVFTCLSHDIIAHEITHALLDGMHPYFNEPTNPDVWAFHEAFADIMALFQHFSYPEVLRHQIANTRGNLETENLLGELAQQFGQTTGGRGALRSALGRRDEKTNEWKRQKPDPRKLARSTTPHERGSYLVAAVFDAFIAIYNSRVADLLRIATGGSGELPMGRLHPDLVNRLAVEAAEASEDVLRICIRAMDYVPPVDITFGEFLRALITADYDLSPATQRRNRIAFIDAFRSWGIYPRDVSTLSEDSLRWLGPDEDAYLANLKNQSVRCIFEDSYQRNLNELVESLEKWQPGSERADVFAHIRASQEHFHGFLQKMQSNAKGQMVIEGLDLRKGASFSVGNLRPSRRLGAQGEFHTEMVIEIVQSYRPPDGGAPFRGGATMIVDLRNWDVRYVIYKRLWDQLPDDPTAGVGVLPNRYYRQREYRDRQRQGLAGSAQAVWQGEDGDSLTDWLSPPPYVSGGNGFRAADGESYTRWMEAGATCELRKSERRQRDTEDEPFALLHRSID